MNNQMTSIQDVYVPYLLAYGHMHGSGCYFIATSFEGDIVSEDCLDVADFERLQAPLSAVHACGILHNDKKGRKRQGR